MLSPPALYLREEGRLAPLKALGFRVPRERWMELPITAFLVEHPREGPVLIDAGLDPSMEFGALLGTVVARSFRQPPEGPIPDQLRARGVDPADVRRIYMTHLHLDHASGVGQFPNATLFTSQAEWRAFTAPRGTLQGYVRSHVPDGFELHELDFAGGHGPFERTLDLFGDGTVRALYTPGHTAGHVSYLLRTASGEVLVAGDAVYTRHTLATGHLPAVMASEERFVASLDQIRRYDGGLVVPGHDMAAWDDLADVY
jgi:glyoxylase-like metal-dependent hydrolase (beta-lactamase superfamily II)